jgi:hypothetical protein
MLTIIIAWERTKFTRRRDKYMRIEKESNIINSVSQKTSEMNKGEGKTQEYFKQPRKNNNKITGVSIYLLVITPNVSGLNFSIKRHSLSQAW